MHTDTTAADMRAGIGLEMLLPAAMQHAAAGLSEMVGRPVSIEVPRVERVPIAHVADLMGGPETDMVCVYLLFEGDVDGQAVLMAPVHDALHLADMLLDEPEGTTTHLGALEQSALAEAGNLTLSFFLNEIAVLSGVSCRPSPPAVMVDMLGAILSVVATPVAGVSDELIIVETVFCEPERIVQVHFWVMPFPTKTTAETPSAGS